MIKTWEKVFKALGDKNRLRIINILMKKSMCVCEIKAILPISQSTVSGHLKVLKEAGLIEDDKNGLWVEYHLNTEDPVMSEILKIIDKNFQADKRLMDERAKSLKTNRYVLCKK